MFSSHLSYKISLIASVVPRIPPNPPELILAPPSPGPAPVLPLPPLELEDDDLLEDAAYVEKWSTSNSISQESVPTIRVGPDMILTHVVVHWSRAVSKKSASVSGHPLLSRCISGPEGIGITSVILGFVANVNGSLQSKPVPVLSKAKLISTAILNTLSIPLVERSSIPVGILLST